VCVCVFEREGVGLCEKGSAFVCICVAQRTRV
jgi:hypothetical protein